MKAWSLPVTCCRYLLSLPVLTSPRKHFCSWTIAPLQTRPRPPNSPERDQPPYAMCDHLNPSHVYALCFLILGLQPVPRQALRSLRRLQLRQAPRPWRSRWTHSQWNPGVRQEFRRPYEGLHSTLSWTLLQPYFHSWTQRSLRKVTETGHVKEKLASPALDERLHHFEITHPLHGWLVALTIIRFGSRK